MYKDDLKTLYYTMIYPYKTFGIEVWGSANKALLDRICIMQKRVIRCIGTAHYLEPTLPMFKRLDILKADELFKLYILKQMHLHCKNESPKPISELFIKSVQVHPYQTRHRSNPRSTKTKLNITSKSFLCVGPKIWSNLQSCLQTIQDTNIFFKRLKRNVLENYA